jgi:type IV pilus assembly protein PilA
MTTTTLRPQLKTALMRQLSQSPSRKKNLLQKGFTLVELMVVIVIVAILSAVALPNFLKQTDKAKATEAKTSISAILKQAQAGFVEDGASPATEATTPTMQAKYGAPAPGVQKFDYTATVAGTAPDLYYNVVATGNNTDGNLKGKKMYGCVAMATGVIKMATNLDETAPDCSK